jgi:hypothetical protein
MDLPMSAELYGLRDRAYRHTVQAKSYYQALVRWFQLRLCARTVVSPGLEFPPIDLGEQ